jgi:membrane-associated phospholipid phosphatase
MQNTRCAPRSAAVLVVLAFACPARASEPRALAHDDPVFLAAELSGSAATALVLGLSAGGPETSCGLCGTNALDVAVRNAIYLHNSRAPALASHAVSSVAAPVLALATVVVPALSYGRPAYALADSVTVMDSALLTLGMTTFTKDIAGRERPSFHFGRGSETEYADKPSERFRSFFSGDTSFAFSVLSSSATLAYERGYVTAPYAAAFGGVLGVATGTLRMMADMHWLTDVLTGAVVGTATGVALPLLLHPRVREEHHVSVMPILTPGFSGAAVSGAF